MKTSVEMSDDQGDDIVTCEKFLVENAQDLRSTSDTDLDFLLSLAKEEISEWCDFMTIVLEEKKNREDRDE